MIKITIREEKKNFPEGKKPWTCMSMVKLTHNVWRLDEENCKDHFKIYNYNEIY